MLPEMMFLSIQRHNIKVDVVYNMFGQCSTVPDMSGLIQHITTRHFAQHILNMVICT